ncbi:MAG: acyl-CoA thioesterase [Myxococcota bacterium]|nr:acyl-CoA thioesterase [Myxococcota bacterium]
MPETPPGRRPSSSSVEMNQIVLPVHANSIGTAFGGVIMSWIDVCAAMAATRHARRVVVTASMDAVDFMEPVHVGDHVCLRSVVNAVGRSSMEVGVRVEAEDPLTGRRVHAVSAYLTFVAIDDAGTPTPVPPLEPETTGERLRMEEAAVRRTKRLELAAERSRLAQIQEEDG